jgi:hypothetical protein
MPRTIAAAFLVALAGSSPAADKYTAKPDDAGPPKELAEPVRSLLEPKGTSVYDDKGKLVCTMWPRKSLEAKAGVTADQAKAGLRYSHLDESTIVGAVKIPEGFTDYRKQKIKPGVYTLRLGIQPMDGDHMGTAPYNEFCLLCPADEDKKPELMEAEAVQELSKKSTSRKHPGVMLLFPDKMPPASPAVEAKPKETWVLSYGVPTTAGGEKATLGFSLVVIGQTMAE